MSSEAPAPPTRPKKGSEIELTFTGVDRKGSAFGLFGAWRVTARGGVPGARARVQVLRRRKGGYLGRVLELVDPGPHSVAARCVHHKSCGGCSFQELAYARQLIELHAQLERQMAPLFGLLTEEPPEVEPVLACADPWHYRNKMDFTFGTKRWIEEHEPEGVGADFALGLHVPGRFDKVLDVQHCDLAFPQASSILATTRRLARELELDAWDVRAHRGLLRHLVLRRAHHSGEVMANLVTTEEARERVAPLVQGLLAAHPEITTFVQNIRTGVALVALGEREIVHHGPGHIVEKLGGLSFRISANSFFQTNTPQAERLAELVLEAAAIESHDVVFDLYCGGGSLTLATAAQAAEVWGFELVPEAIRDAEENAARNGISNARFVAGDLASTIALESLEGLAAPVPTVCVVDPPRAGMHDRVITALRRLAPRRIVLVSCNPQSAARDLEPLIADYHLARVQPIDLFPHTPHLECVFTLNRRAEA